MSNKNIKRGRLIIYEDETMLHILAEDQEWGHPKVKKQLLELGIIFHHGGVTPIRIIPRENCNPLLQLGGEDDGHIWFKKDANDDNVFDVYWATTLIKDLRMALKIFKKIKIEVLNDHL